MTSKSTKKIKILAHRGSRELVPENSLSALALAGVAGFKYVEFDVQMSADHQLFVFHDGGLKRMTGVNKKLRECNASELSRLSLRGSKGDKIPFFEDWMSMCSRYNILPQIEIKSPFSATQAGRQDDRNILVEKIQAYFQKNSTELPGVRLSSFDFKILQQLRVCLPEVDLALLVEKAKPELLEQLESIQAVGCHMRYQTVTQAVVAQVHGVGCEVLSYTVNTKKQAEKLLATGADGFFTNSTELMLAY